MHAFLLFNAHSSECVNVYSKHQYSLTLTRSHTNTQTHSLTLGTTRKQVKSLKLWNVREYIYQVNMYGTAVRRDFYERFGPIGLDRRRKRVYPSNCCSPSPILMLSVSCAFWGNVCGNQKANKKRILMGNWFCTQRERVYECASGFANLWRHLWFEYLKFPKVAR